MTLDLLVDGAFIKLLNKIPKNIYQGLSSVLSYLPEDYMWRAGYQSYGGDGRVRLFKKNKFPTGLLPYVKEYCYKNNVSINLTYADIPVVGDLVSFDTPEYNLSEDYSLRNYQQEAIDAILEHKRGLIQCPTGSGKSFIAAKLIEAANLYPVLVCLTSKDLLEQTVANYEEYLGVKVGKISAGKFDYQPITIGMIQSINSALSRKNPEVKRYLQSVKCLIVDECHHQVAATVQKVTYSCINAEILCGFSGTPQRDKADDMEIEAALGPIVYKLTASDLIRMDYLVKPKIYMFDMPTKYLTTKPYPQYSDIIADYIESNFDRNKIISKLVQFLVDDNKNCLVLCNRIQHGEVLESLIPNSVFVHGETPVDTRTEVFKAFKDRKINTLIATSIIDEGWDCPNLDSLVLAHPYKSVVKCFQRLGRALRKCPGKEEAIIVDFYDDVKYLKKHAKKRLDLYASEPEFEVIHKALQL